MTIAQAREAAKQVRESLQRLEKLFPSIREGKSNFTIMSDFILDHFPEDGEERVTEEWLREEYDFEWDARVKGKCYFKIGDCIERAIVFSGSQPVVIIHTAMIPITTRHQARQLFQALGTKPKTPENKAPKNL